MPSPRRSGTWPPAGSQCRAALRSRTSSACDGRRRRPRAGARTAGSAPHQSSWPSVIGSKVPGYTASVGSRTSCRSPGNEVAAGHPACSASMRRSVAAPLSPARADARPGRGRRRRATRAMARVPSRPARPGRAAQAPRRRSARQERRSASPRAAQDAAATSRTADRGRRGRTHPAPPAPSTAARRRARHAPPRPKGAPGSPTGWRERRSRSSRTTPPPRATRLEAERARAGEGVDAAPSGKRSGRAVKSVSRPGRGAAAARASATGSLCASHAPMIRTSRGSSRDTLPARGGFWLTGAPDAVAGKHRPWVPNRELAVVEDAGASTASAPPMRMPSERCSSAPTPPEAITGTSTASATARVRARSKPTRVPSRSMLVSRISPAPSEAMRRAQATASRPVLRLPPWV